MDLVRFGADMKLQNVNSISYSVVNQAEDIVVPGAYRWYTGSNQTLYLAYLHNSIRSVPKIAIILCMRAYLRKVVVNAPSKLNCLLHRGRLMLDEHNSISDAQIVESLQETGVDLSQWISEDTLKDRVDCVDQVPASLQNQLTSREVKTLLAKLKRLGLQVLALNASAATKGRQTFTESYVPAIIRLFESVAAVEAIHALMEDSADIASFIGHYAYTPLGTKRLTNWVARIPSSVKLHPVIDSIIVRKRYNWDFLQVVKRARSYTISLAGVGPLHATLMVTDADNLLVDMVITNSANDVRTQVIDNNSKPEWSQHVICYSVILLALAELLKWDDPEAPLVLRTLLSEDADYLDYLTAIRKTFKQFEDSELPGAIQRLVMSIGRGI